MKGRFSHSHRVNLSALETTSLMALILACAAPAAAQTAAVQPKVANGEPAVARRNMPKPTSRASALRRYTIPDSISSPAFS
jgi:hypothetical protein